MPITASAPRKSSSVSVSTGETVSTGINDTEADGGGEEGGEPPELSRSRCFLGVTFGEVSGFVVFCFFEVPVEFVFCFFACGFK